MKENFFIYARKSTDDQDKQVRSIQDQITELRKFALQNEIEVIEILTEKKSAKTTGREIFDSMLKRIANKNAK